MSKNNETNGSTAALVLGIIAIVFAFIPVVNNFIAIPLGAIGLILAIVAFARKRRGGTAVAGLVLGIIAIGLTLTMNAAIYGAVKTIDNAVKTSNEQQAKETSRWTKDIYDSITQATADYMKTPTAYTGGTLFADIVTKVGNPTSTTESGDTATASWTSVTTDNNSKSITLIYDKTSGQITNKSETGL
jgi:hypothetical protein